MYQIVLTSQFIRDLKEITGPGNPQVEVPPSEPAAADVVPLRRARTGLAGIGALVFGAATRLLGAH